MITNLIVEHNLKLAKLIDEKMRLMKSMGLAHNRVTMDEEASFAVVAQLRLTADFMKRTLEELEFEHGQNAVYKNGTVIDIIKLRFWLWARNKLASLK